MFQIKKDETTPERRRIPILLVDATDGYTAETGVTSPTIYISKNGSVAAGAGTFTQLSSTNMPGQYYYEFTAGEVDALGYIQFYCIKSGTSRAYHAIVQINAYDVMDATSLGISRLDDTISSRSTVTGIWNAATSSLTTASSIGKLLVDNINATISSRSTLTAANVWDAATSGLTTVGSIGKQIVDNLNATITSRSTLTASDVWNTLTSSLTTVSSIGKLLVDNINATISSRSTLTAQNVWDALTSNLTTVNSIGKRLVDNVDTTISSRLASSSYTTPPTAAVIADAVWDETANQHTGGGTFGKEIDLLKKANYTTESQVNSSITPSTTTFSTPLTNVTGFFNDQTIIFTTGALTGQSRVIQSFTNNTTYSTIVLNDALTSAPASGAEFVILANHSILPDVITENLWNETRATSSPSGGIPAVGTYGYFLDSRVSTAGGQGGGSASVINGPYVLVSEQQSNDIAIDVLLGSVGDFVFETKNTEGVIVPLSASNTNNIKIYNQAGTLVETAAGTVNYAAGGIVTANITTTTTNTAGTYDVILETIDASSNVIKFGPIKMKVRAL